MSRLFLVDSHALLHRAFHAMSNSKLTYQGKPIGAVYGFFSMFLAAVFELKPTYLATCFDSSEPTFRHKKFIAYQAHRPATEEQLKSQIDLTREILGEAKIPLFVKPGYEADDLIGTIAEKSQKKREVKEIIIVTGDKDLMQLVKGKTRLFLLAGGGNASQISLVGSDGVQEKLGIRPDQVIDYKALVGDSSDNYPGVYGIGPKTAEELLENYDNLKNIYQNLDKIKESWRNKLVNGREAAQLSQELAKIVLNTPINFSLERSCWDEKSLLTLKHSLRRFNFRSLVGRIEKYFDQGNLRKQMKLI